MTFLIERIPYMDELQANAKKWLITPAHDRAVYSLLEDLQTLMEGTFELDESDDYWDALEELTIRFCNKYKNNMLAIHLAKSYTLYQQHRLDAMQRANRM